MASKHDCRNNNTRAFHELVLWFAVSASRERERLTEFVFYVDLTKCLIQNDRGIEAWREGTRQRFFQSSSFRSLF